MDWDEAIDKAKKELGIIGYTSHWDEVVERAKEILSEEASAIARTKHLTYLKSIEWEQRRKQILKRDNYLCQDCLRLNLVDKITIMFKTMGILINKINYQVKAEQVHHINYNWVGIDSQKEIDNCISLCEICHKLRHTNYSLRISELKSRRIAKIRSLIYFELLHQKSYVDWEQKQHEENLKSITIKLHEFFKWVEEQKEDIKKGDMDGIQI